jgi:peptidyl-prolyl cis-trans isomerase SurA
VSAAKPTPPADDSIADRVVAVVNNDAITLGELTEMIVAYRQENRQRATPSEDELASQFLNRLIENRLQLQEAEREKIVVDEAEITEELNDRVKKLGAPTFEAFEQSLKTQGITMESVRRRIRDSIRMSRVVRRKVALRVSVTEVEIDRYLAENREKLETGLSYHARHILIVPEGTSESAWAAARARADKVHEELMGGADFAEAARNYSADASAKDGGDLGTLKRGELAQDVESQIVRLSEGQVSPPYRSSLGWHLFKLESKEALEGGGLTRARQQVREILFREKYEARLDAWLKEIRQRAVIEVRL